MNTETQQFISDNIDVDIHNLALNSTHNKQVDLALAIRQINGKQKTKNKIPQFFDNDGILFPVQLSLEQSSSELTAKYKSELCSGDSLVDLTGGFGVDCFFMAQKFRQVIYIERDTELCYLAKHNFKILDSNNIEVKNTTSEIFLEKINIVDWIYIDPARRGTNGKKLVLLSDCEPDINLIQDLLLKKSNSILVKLSPMMDISAAIQNLQTCCEVHILSIENECKEILLILSHSKCINIKVKTINIQKNGLNQTFEYNFNDEKNASISLTSNLEKYLYEPNSAIMKSGAFKTISEQFKIPKLHVNTHLYTSNELITNFPGRIFEVIKTWENSKNELKKLVHKIPKANLSVRNYPTTVENFRKKLNIKDGGDVYLFACRVGADKKQIIECKKAKLTD